MTALPDPEDLKHVDFGSLSLIEQLSLLPEADRDAELALLSPEDLASPELWARPSQLKAINSPSWLTIAVAGRGFGKTWVGAHWVIKKARIPGTRIALVGRTVADVRDVMVLGESGILANSPDTFMPDYAPSVRRIVWPNGSIATTYSADAPDQLRGPQQHYAWADEIAAFKDKPDASGLTAWDQVLISTRLGKKPQILATTTPKRTPPMRELFRRAATEPDRVKLISGSTMENRANLAPDYIQQMHDMYAGTALERQELYGELLSIVEGALWRDSDFMVFQDVDPDVIGLQTVIAVDPGASATGDATGIVVVTSTLEQDLSKRRAWIREDQTVQAEPEEWAKAVAEAWARYQPRRKGELPPIVVAEQNQGGAMIRAVIQQANPAISVCLVPAVVNKAQRAEPVVMAYRQGRVKHVEMFDELQEEMTTWEPTSKWSPNHMDALVHGVRILLIDPRPLAKFGHVVPGVLGDHAMRNAIPDHRRGRATSGLKVAPWRQRIRR
jgi:phage terminase large subunit-like protein